MKLRKGIEGFIKGMGNILQLFPEPIKLEDINSNYSCEYSPLEQDARALDDDWNNIGKDMNYALNKLEGTVLT
jgi:hypothetical protein